MTQEVKKGMIARVRCGRGAGRLVLVLEMDEDGRLLVADGRRIRVEKPKVKNRKHLTVLAQTDGTEEAPSNRRVRERLRDAEKGIIEQEGLFCQRMT